MKTIDYFLDCEFYEDGTTIDLISIALVCEDGRELYRVNQDARLPRVSQWVRENVLPQLPRYGAPEWMPYLEIRDDVRSFTKTKEGERACVWAYYADYDWVVFCQLFGTMMDLPEHLPKFCMDLKQWAVSLGNPTLPEQGAGAHNALEDARWNKQVHAFLSERKREREGLKAKMESWANRLVTLPAADGDRAREINSTLCDLSGEIEEELEKL